ncbi:CRISPR-associated endonuclease Cas2 [Geothrix sp. 21YS21S-4]|uniref:CRISPR-associated endonuclease Cas2 n=1 Tax=Geothrix sp. 21YS21S-4 TaxID=3068889 RepID=UPI0027B9AC04|nr:CRISPR-associated endonuclease Cas2 [Geothrix sp. 21YS21S-4]
MKHPPERHWYLVAYDVADDKKRAKVAKCLEGFGERIQYSVFRTFLSGRALARLRWELSRIMAPLDGLLIIHLCPSCQARIQDRKGKRDWKEEAPLGFRISGQSLKHPSPGGIATDSSQDLSKSSEPSVSPQSMNAAGSRKYKGSR